MSFLVRPGDDKQGPLDSCALRTSGILSQLDLVTGLHAPVSLVSLTLVFAWSRNEMSGPIPGLCQVKSRETG